MVKKKIIEDQELYGLFTLNEILVLYKKDRNNQIVDKLFGIEQFIFNCLRANYINLFNRCPRTGKGMYLF